MFLSLVWFINELIYRSSLHINPINYIALLYFWNWREIFIAYCLICLIDLYL